MYLTRLEFWGSDRRGGGPCPGGLASGVEGSKHGRHINITDAKPSSPPMFRLIFMMGGRLGVFFYRFLAEALLAAPSTPPTPIAYPCLAEFLSSTTPLLPASPPPPPPSSPSGGKMLLPTALLAAESASPPDSSSRRNSTLSSALQNKDKRRECDHRHKKTWKRRGWGRFCHRHFRVPSTVGRVIM